MFWMYNNPISARRLETHPKLRGTHADDEEGSDNDVHSHHDGE